MSNITKHLSLGIITLTMFLASCSKEEINPASKVIEQSNISISGDINYFDMQENANDMLIQTEVKGTSANDLTFIINLENGHDLKIRLFDRYASNVWETAQYFPILLTADTATHTRYVEASYILNTDAANYSTHLGNNVPNTLDTNPIRVVYFDAEKNEVKCQIEGMILYKNLDSSKSITVNGTFVSSLSEI
jgi:hypothetical protein